MASYEFCINKSVEAGRISRQVADDILASADPEGAVNSMVADLSRFKREAALEAVRLADAWENMTGHPGGLYDGLMALMARDPTGKANYFNVDYLARVYKGRFHSDFAQVMDRFKTTKLGWAQDEDGLKNLVRAIYDEAVDDPEIGEFAQLWKDLAERVRTEFNRVGGSISKNEQWLLPQAHNKDSVTKAGKEVWLREITDLLDREKMTDDLGNPLTDEQFEAALDYTYETITTGGINKTKDFSVPHLGKKLSRKGSEKRFLYFKNADAWLSYQDKYGRGDIFTNLTGYLDDAAQDIALMEILGPSPENTFKTLRNQAEKQATFTQRQRGFSDAVFNVVSGKINEGELTGLADFFQSTRNLLTSSTLGSAWLSSISDVGLNTITSLYNNLPALKVLKRQMSLLKPGNEEDRLFAVQLGLVADNWAQRANASNRYADVYGTGVTTKIAETVMRGSLLSPWTDAGRKAFGMEYSSLLAKNFNKTFDELPDKIKRSFDTYGINEADWNTFRATEPLDHQGVKFADMTNEGGSKFHAMVLSETDFAVPTPDARVQAITTAGTGRSTLTGQLVRTGMSLKSFPITLATTHFYRAAYQATTSEKLGYLGTLLVTTTALGAIALQAKDIAKGREPRPMDEKMLYAAFIQGGGAGIFGDFIFSDVNRFGGGISQTLLGPGGELFDKTVGLTLGNVREAITGEETNVVPELIQYLKRYTPKTWQTQLLQDSMWDNLEIMANPKAQRRFNKIMRKRMKEYNQGYFWAPGESIPEKIDDILE